MAADSGRYFGLRRKSLIKRIPELVIGLVALAAYVFYLNHEDARVRDHFAQSRIDSPSTYLDQVRVVRGFDAYLAAYFEINRSDEFTGSVPDFLIGRWALFDHELRVDTQYSASACRHSLLIENGRMTPPGAGAPISARYRLSGNRLIVKIATGKLFPIILVSSGVFLHHLEIGGGVVGARKYAYRCD